MASMSDHRGPAGTARAQAGGAGPVAKSAPYVPLRTRGLSTGGAGGGPRERRTSAKLVRFSSGELAVVALRAAECGRPIACYIREAALGAALHARRTPLNDALIRELTRLANQLGELGRSAQALDLPVASEFERALGAVLTMIQSIE